MASGGCGSVRRRARLLACCAVPAAMCPTKGSRPTASRQSCGIHQYPKNHKQPSVGVPVLLYQRPVTVAPHSTSLDPWGATSLCLPREVVVTA